MALSGDIRRRAGDDRKRSANVVSVVKKGEWKGALIQGGRCEESRRLILGCFTPEERVGRVTVGGGGGQDTHVSLPALAVKQVIMIAMRPPLPPRGGGCYNRKLIPSIVRRWSPLLDIAWT